MNVQWQAKVARRDPDSSPQGGLKPNGSAQSAARRQAPAQSAVAGVEEAGYGFV
jgi:hypothetical protein